MEEGLRLDGLIFMIFAWASIILLNVFCFYHIYKEKQEKLTGPLEVEAELDKIDK